MSFRRARPCAGHPRLCSASKSWMAGTSPAMTAVLQTPRDQQLHDLVGAGVDALYARIAVHARDRIFVHITIAAEQLQAAVDNLVLQIGEPVFGHRRRHGVEFMAEVALDAVVVEHAADGRLAL